jgi:hypothetical protein
MKDEPREKEHNKTEHHGTVVSISASYSTDISLQSCPGDWLSQLWYFMNFLQISKQILG